MISVLGRIPVGTSGLITLMQTPLTDAPSVMQQQLTAALSRGPLEAALAARDCDAVRKAIEAGADVNAPFGDGLTPLCRMAALGERRILKLLLCAKATVDASACRTETVATNSTVAEHVADAGFAALHWSAREGKLECARMLIEASATIDVRTTDDITPFMLACKSGHHECARLLMRAGADVEAANLRGGTAMVVACVMGEAETVRQLLSMRANADALTVAVDDLEQLFQCRPLVTACRYNHPKCVSLLLGAGVSSEAMSTALDELKEFPSFIECMRLVRRAMERKGPAASADVAATDDDFASAEARAEEAMAALLAEEDTGGRKMVGKAKAKAKVADLCPTPGPPSATSKKRRKKKASHGATAAENVAEAAQAAAPTDAPDEPDAPDAPDAVTVAAPATAAAAVSSSPATSKREGAGGDEGARVSDMNALASEYEAYVGSRLDGESMGLDGGLSKGEEEAEGVEEGVVEEEGTADEEGPLEVVRSRPASHAGSRRGSRRGSRDSRDAPVAVGPDDLSEPADDASSGQAARLTSDYKQLDQILQRNESSRLQELDMFLHRKKFTTSAMT